MVEEPIQSEVPPKRKVPRWLIIVGIVAGIGCLCVVIGVVISTLTLLNPSINASRLPDVCIQNNPSMDRQACATWAEDVKSTTEYNDCFLQDASTGHPDVNNLYACLVENGVGPD